MHQHYSRGNFFFLLGGKLCQEKEVLILIKTVKSKSKKLINKIIKIHSYEVPEILFFRVDEGEKNYLKWLNEMVKKKIDRNTRKMVI